MAGFAGAHVADRVKPSRPDLVARARRPDYALGAHTASLGLASSTGAQLGPAYAHGMFVGQHGSWNREPRSGYKVVFVAFDDDGAPVGAPADVVTGFVDDDGNTSGRPVGVAVGSDGALYVADDVGNAVWRVSGAETGTHSASAK